MTSWKARLGAVAFLLVCVATNSLPADQVLVAAGSAWKYNDSGADLGTAWRAPAYNDAGWASGLAQLGYGDGDEATVLGYGGVSTNKYITYYFRRSFNVADPSLFTGLTLRYLRDDGAVIYLNGTEVLRSNMPAGSITAATLAPVAIGGADETTWLQAPAAASLLVTGTNVIAVEIHQQSATSTDISFDLELTAATTQAGFPAVTLVSPANSSVVNTTSVTFTANASASAGLASATLLVGPPPQTVTFSGPAQVEDAQITADTPTVPNGTGASINVDGQTPHAHGLMKFPTLIGNGAGQVPPGSVINSATLQVNCTNPGMMMNLYRLTQDWVENQASWNERSIGAAWGSPGADGAASNAGVPISGDCTSAGTRTINLTPFVQEWSSGLPNYGVVFTDSGTDGVDFDSSESAVSPVLTVVYKSAQQPIETKPLSGTSAPVSFTTDLTLGQSYSWNVRVTDTLGQQATAPADFLLTVDSSAPDEPVLISPANGATGVPLTPQLSVSVSNPDGGDLNVTFEMRKAPPAEFTIIALPDTQHYSEQFPAIYTNQTQWIVNNKAARNIVFVTHEGDIVQNVNNATEWQRANTSMSLLDGVVPYGMGPGNHDEPTTLYNQYFPYTRYEGQPWYGGHYQNLNDNNYELITSGGVDFLIIHLDFCPAAAVITWADSILKQYPDRIGMVTTHAYLGLGAVRNTHVCGSTQYIWDGLAPTNPNLHFMLSGHVHGEARRTDVINGHPIYQMLADYQDRTNGGDGWLRILRFVPGDDKVYVQTYSPWLNQFESDADSEFTLDFPMAGAFATVGSVQVPSGSTASVTATNLLPNTVYEWRATVTNSNNKTRSGALWTFTTGSGGAVNQPPVASPQTVNTPEDTSAAVTLTATDGNNDPLTYSVVSQPSHGTLSGAAPNLTYQPAANYSGPDSFTFKANDGQADSNTATVSINVAAVNDPPAANADAYSTPASTALTISAPGVLANDADIDGPALSAQLVATVTHGSLTLNADGSFVYTPAAGYSGPDAFTYRASDSVAQSAIATVSLTVTPPAPVISANFNANADSFAYADNTFRGAAQSNYASGTRVANGGFTGGGLQVLLGGVNNTLITGMSGGWSRTFNLASPRALTLTFRYNLNQGKDYESNEISQVLASLDGVLLGISPADYVAQVAGNGNGGPNITTGWQQFTISLGTLPAGNHTLTLGGYNNQKDSNKEQTTILIDDVTVQ